MEKNYDISSLPILGGIPAEEISSTNIRELKMTFQNRGNKPTTINRYMGYLNQIFSLKWNDIDWDKRQLRYYMPKVNDSKLIPLSEDFIEELKNVKLLQKQSIWSNIREKPLNQLRQHGKQLSKEPSCPIHQDHMTLDISRSLSW